MKKNNVKFEILTIKILFSPQYIVGLFANFFEVLDFFVCLLDKLKKKQLLTEI